MLELAQRLQLHEGLVGDQQFSGPDQSGQFSGQALIGAFAGHQRHGHELAAQIIVARQELHVGGRGVATTTWIQRGEAGGTVEGGGVHQVDGRKVGGQCGVEPGRKARDEFRGRAAGGSGSRQGGTQLSKIGRLEINESETITVSFSVLEFDPDRPRISGDPFLLVW